MSAQGVRASWVLILVAVAGILLAGPAQAHSDLRSSDPADGATLAEAPTAISFTFNERLLAQGNAITVTEVATGQRLDVGATEVDGEIATVSWPESSPGGEYRAAYRVVSADGHPINGTITFTVAQSAGSGSATSSTVPGQLGGGESPESEPMQPTASAATPVPVATAADQPADDGGSSSALVLFVALGVAIVLGALGGAWFMRRAR